MVIEEPENEEVDGFEGDLAPDQDYHEGSPLALDVIAGLQPAHVEVAFDWTTNSSVGRRAIAATVATEHAFTHHGADSAQELLARIEYIQNDNKMFSIEKAVQTQFPNAPQSDFYSEPQMKQYNEYMFTCRSLQTSLKTHVVPTAVRQDLESLLQRTATSAAALWVTARIGFAGATAFRNATGGGEESYLAVYAPQLAVANEAQRAEEAHAAKRPRYPSFGQGAGQNYQGLTPFVKGGSSWDTSSAAVQAQIWCYQCGEPGHKSNECYSDTGYQSAAQPAAAQNWGGASAVSNWQFPQPVAEQVFPALEWHQDWQPEAHRNAQPAWFQNTDRSAGKTGGKSAGGKSSGYGGYGKGRGVASSFKGGGKNWGGSKGGRGGGSQWPGF